MPPSYRASGSFKLCWRAGVHLDLLQRPHSLVLMLSLHVPYMMISTHVFFLNVMGLTKTCTYLLQPFYILMYHLFTHLFMLPYYEELEKESQAVHNSCLKCWQL